MADIRLFLNNFTDNFMKCPVEMDQNYINYLKIPVCFDSHCFGSLCAYFII